MNRLISFVVTGCALVGSTANAALLTVEPTGVSSNGVYVLYLAGESTVFNAVGLSVKPDNGVWFLNVPTATVWPYPIPPGRTSTYRNRFLDADPFDVPESKGWTFLSVANTAAELAFSGGPLGQTIDTSGDPGGRLWLANLMLPPGATATATLHLVNGIDTVHTQTLQFPIPEPVGLVMTSVGILPLLVRRRQSLGDTTMKALMFLVVAACALSCSAANAALLTVEPAGISPNGVYTLYLAGESTVFNAVGLSVKPDDGVSFLNFTQNSPSTPRPPGQPFTYRSRYLDADPLDVPESKGWTMLGIVNTVSEVAFSGGPLGQLIDTSGDPDGKLWLANLMLPPGATATATLHLVNGIDTVHTQTLQFPIPEPAGYLLAALAAARLVGRHRRETSQLSSPGATGVSPVQRRVHAVRRSVSLPSDPSGDSHWP